VPFGYLNENGYVTKDPLNFDKIQKAWELMATGGKSLAEIAKIMNDLGLRQNKKGVIYPLARQSFHHIFRNKFYMGILTSERYPEEVKGQHPPMVTEQQFYRVQAILDGRNVNIATPLAKKNKDNTEFPLRRVMHCGKCGTVFTGAWTKGRNDKYQYYFCRNRCGASSVPVEEVHKKLLELLEFVTPTEDCLRLFIALLRRTYLKRISQLQKKKDEADAQLTKLYALRQSLIEKNLTGIYSDEIFREQNKLLEEKITVLHVTKSDSLLRKYNLEEIIAFIKEYFEDLGKTYTNSNLTLKKILLGSIFASKLTWNYPGISNQEISPLFQYVRQFENNAVGSGEPGGIRTRDQELKRLLLYR
jgi:site-specific DNA recombinase